MTEVIGIRNLITNKQRKMITDIGRFRWRGCRKMISNLEMKVGFLEEVAPGELNLSGHW